MSITPPIAASSLHTVLHLADNPSATAPLPTSGDPLTFHLIRVPSSSDLFLTTLPPSATHRVTGADIESSLYYLRITLPEPPLQQKAAKRKSLSLRSVLKQKAPVRKDNFEITVIRRNPYSGEQVTVAEVESSAEGLGGGDVKGKRREVDEGWWELEKPAIRVRMCGEGYGEVEREVVFCRRGGWWRRWEGSVRREMERGHGEKDREEEEGRREGGWGGYSFDSVWGEGENLERRGGSARWVEWEGKEVPYENRVQRCVFEEVVGGKIMKLKLKRPGPHPVSSTVGTPAPGTPARAPSPASQPPPPPQPGLAELPEAASPVAPPHEPDQNATLRPPLPGPATSHTSTLSHFSKSSRHNKPPSQTLLTIDFHMPKYEASPEFVFKTKKEREIEASLGPTEKVPQAKVATITVSSAGLAALDLVIAASVGVMWRRVCGWEEERRGWVG